MNKAFGIDLGITYSCSGKLDPIRSNPFNVIMTDSGQQIPSVVSYKEDEVWVGKDARTKSNKYYL